jgi:hypothetical protein
MPPLIPRKQIFINASLSLLQNGYQAPVRATVDASTRNQRISDGKAQLSQHTICGH